MKPDRALNLRMADMPFESMLQLQEDMIAFKDRMNVAQWCKLKAIIASVCDWTEDELGRLSAREVGELMLAIRNTPFEEQSDAIPPQTGTPSDITPQALESASPAGSSS